MPRRCESVLLFLTRVPRITPEVRLLRAKYEAITLSYGPLLRHVDTILMSSASANFFLRPSLRCLIAAAARTIESRGPECNRSQQPVVTFCVREHGERLAIGSFGNVQADHVALGRPYIGQPNPCEPLLRTAIFVVFGILVRTTSRTCLITIRGVLSPYSWRHLRRWRWRRRYSPVLDR